MFPERVVKTTRPRIRKETAGIRSGNAGLLHFLETALVLLQYKSKIGLKGIHS